MTLSFFVRTCAAGSLAFCTVVFAQQTARAQGAGAPGAGAAAAPQQTTATEQQITVAGCIQREADYRKARDAGKGGVAGTGVGAANEFVLINATMAANAGSPSAGATAGTAGTTAAYELTGANEKQAEQFVGKRVEISGKLKAAETAAGRPTGGPTAGKPPAGVDVASADLQLRELEVTSVKAAASGTCPAQ
jgi:hypothetical protein